MWFVRRHFFTQYYIRRQRTPFIITHTEVAGWYFASAVCLVMAPICHSARAIVFWNSDSFCCCFLSLCSSAIFTRTVRARPWDLANVLFFAYSTTQFFLHIVLQILFSTVRLWRKICRNQSEAMGWRGKDTNFGMALTSNNTHFFHFWNLKDKYIRLQTYNY